jgi:hypothetical protein
MSPPSSRGGCTLAPFHARVRTIGPPAIAPEVLRSGAGDRIAWNFRELQMQHFEPRWSSP